MNTESVPLEWHGKHAEENPVSGLAASHTAHSSSPDLVLRSNEQHEMSATLIGVLLGFIMAMCIGYFYKLRELRSSKRTARSEAEDVLAEIKNQAEYTVPPSTLPSIMEALKAVLEGRPRLEIIKLLTILSNRYQYEQYAESNRMLDTIREKLNRLASIKDGYDSLLTSPKVIISAPINAELLSDATAFSDKYAELFFEFLELNLDNLATRDNQEISALCTKITKYYQLSLGRYLSHSCTSKFPFDLFD